MRYCYAHAVVVGAIVAAGVPVADAAPLTQQQKIELLTAQNKYRAELGLPALKWSDNLAASARAWALYLANDVHTLVHSHAPAVGENLAMWTTGYASLTYLVDLWGREKPYFIQALFPDVSRDGNWETVGHYTQLVWRNTTQVGCGFATDAGNDFLVCHYAPAGNYIGEKVY